MSNILLVLLANLAISFYPLDRRYFYFNPWQRRLFFCLFRYIYGKSTSEFVTFLQTSSTSKSVTNLWPPPTYIYTFKLFSVRILIRCCHGFLNDLRLTSACTLLAKNLPLRKYFAQNIMRYVISIKTTANSIQMDL